MARTRPKTTGTTSGSKTTSKETPTRGYKSTNKVDNDYESDDTNTPKPVGLGRGRGNRAKAGNTSLPQRQKACNTSLLTDKKAGNTSLSSETKTCKTGLDPNDLKAGNTSLSTDNKACNTSLSTESAKAGYTSLSSSTKTCKTSLSIEPSKIGVTNLNSNNLTSSTNPNGFHHALSAFNNIKSSSKPDFFKSFVKHDPKYQPKYKRFKARPDPKQQEHLHKSRLFHGWLNQPSSYPSEYYNYLHGHLNYWYTPNTGNTFKPDLSLKPFVPHPHMHPLYAKTFLNIPHIHQTEKYMLPSYENHNQTIFVQNHRTMVATDMSEADCESFYGILIRNLPNKGQARKRISEYVFFHCKTVGRIPYDSEIVHFLHQYLNITPSSFINSLGQDDVALFNTLLMRIHDSCCTGLFRIKLIRENKPSNGKHSWKKHLTREEKEVFGDPNLKLRPFKKKAKTLDYYQPSNRQQNLASVKVETNVNVKKSDTEVTQENVRKTDIIEIDMSSDEKDTPTIEMFPNAESDPLIQELRLNKTSKPTAKINQPKVQVTNTSVPALLNKASSLPKPMEQHKTRSQGGWSNYKSSSKASTSSSWVIPKKPIPQKTPFSESIEKKKKSFLKAAVVPTAKTSKVNKSSIPTHTSKNDTPSKSLCNNDSTDIAKSSNKEINREWREKFILIRGLCDFDICADFLPPSWTSAEGGCHPLQSSLDEVQKLVRMHSMLDLRTISENDLKDQLEEAGYGSSETLVCELESELEHDPQGPSKCRVELHQNQMLKFMKAVHQQNILWDIGFQMNHLKYHCKSSQYRNHNFTTRCYCPCGNYMKKWREYHEINLILGQGGAINCKKKGCFKNPEDLYAHLHSLSGSCLLHRSFAMYLRNLYPDQVRNKKYEVFAEGTWDFKPRYPNSVSLPSCIKNIPVNLTLFEIRR